MPRRERLRPGDVIEMQRREWIVEKVSECAARVRLLGKKIVKLDGKEFEARQNYVTYISAYSEVDVIRKEKP